MGPSLVLEPKNSPKMGLTLKDLLLILALVLSLSNVSICNEQRDCEKEKCEQPFKLTVIILTMNRPHSLAR